MSSLPGGLTFLFVIPLLLLSPQQSSSNRGGAMMLVLVDSAAGDYKFPGEPYTLTEKNYDGEVIENLNRMVMIRTTTSGCGDRCHKTTKLFNKLARKFEKREKDGIVFGNFNVDTVDKSTDSFPRRRLGIDSLWGPRWFLVNSTFQNKRKLGLKQYGMVEINSLYFHGASDPTYEILYTILEDALKRWDSLKEIEDDKERNKKEKKLWKMHIAREKRRKAENYAMSQQGQDEARRKKKLEEKKKEDPNFEL